MTKSTPNETVVRPKYQSTVVQLLKTSLARLQDKHLEICKGYIALGYKSEPAEGVPKELYPWDPKVHKVCAVTFTGLLCYAAEAPPDNPVVQAAHAVCTQVLGSNPDVWTDQPGVDAAQVAEFLQRVIDLHEVVDVPASHI